MKRYEEGGSLSEYLHNNNNVLNMNEKIHILSGIAHSLSELHSHGIVHGNLNPNNIYLDKQSNPKVKLTNFGLNKIYEEKYDTNGNKEMKNNKIVYSAPEMLIKSEESNEININYSKVSRKTDIYALGIIIFEVLTQKRPFSNINSEEEFLLLLSSGFRLSVDELPVDTPVGIVELLLSMWQEESSKRASSMECFSTFHFCSKKHVRRFSSNPLNAA